MITPVSRQAYQAEYDVLDLALESERGIQRLFHTKGEKGKGEAYNARTRLNKARDYDRMANSRMYPPDHPEHGATPYAKLTIRRPWWDEDQQAWVLELQKNTIESMIIRDIPMPEEEEEDELERRI